MSGSSDPEPTRRPAEAPTGERPRRPELGSSPLTVLVVEDDPVAGEFLVDMLEARGHEVRVAESAEQGLEFFRAERPPLVLLDRTLPEMDGVELCRRIRKLPNSEDTVILFVTGAEAHEALDDALQAGANDYVVKPVSPDLLHVRVAIAERRIAERRAHRDREAELQEQSYRDDVTGLGNRTMLRDQIEKAAGRARRADDYLFAVAVVDLDGFHGINERHGREVADEVLRAVGRRIDECLRDLDTVSRIAGDQFGILLDDLAGESDPTRVASRIQGTLSNPVGVQGTKVYVSACIGIVLSSTHYGDAEELLRDAMKALTRAKAQGRGEVQVYDPDVHARAVARVELENKIRTALEREELALHYQPILSLESGRIMSVEALLRWDQGGESSLTLPPDLIPVAEETGLILPLGWWTLERACRQLREWSDAGSVGEELDVSVNVSARQLVQPEMEEIVARTLERTGIPGERLHLEITESSVMADVAGTLPRLLRLKEMGLHLHIDDFGTGYSSLSHLSRLPFDTLKIDREFIWQMGESSEDLEVVRTIVQLARALRMGIVAEGVETADQESRLLELDCDFVQGYRYHRPMSADGIVELLGDGTRA